MSEPMTINKGHNLSEVEIIAGFAALDTSLISDAMERMGVVDSRIRPMWPGAHLVGRAFTVWTHSGDNLYLRNALTLIEPGDVLVVNGQGDETRALLGDLIAEQAQMRGAAGVVIDGAVRDIERLEKIGLPVFARAVTPAGPYHNGPGRLRCPVAIGGVVVADRDIVIGDANGVVVVPDGEASFVLTAVFTLAEEERNQFQQ